MNLEYLAQTVWTAAVDGAEVAYPDTVVGTDSHHHDQCATMAV